MADFAGARAAIIARFVAQWVVDTDPRTRIARVNEPPAEPWPPRDDNNALEPWVLLEVTAETSGVATMGGPGNNAHRYAGTIAVHCYVPVGRDVDDAFDLAIAAGEIFRNQVLYDDVRPGCFVRTDASPAIGRGQQGDDDGVWYRVTATIPFEYFHRA